METLISDKLVSIVVPVYNTELYIKKCIESLINQTYKNIEIIVVDNCSNDSSLSIIRDFGDNRIKVYQNSKTFSAGYSRNRGIEYANGDYICFVDSDDYAEPEFVATMIGKLEVNKDLNIVQCCYRSFDELGDYKDYLPYKEDKYFSGRDLCVLMNRFVGLCGPNTMIWNKMYRKSVFDNYRFYEGRYYEDMYLSYKILYNESKVLWIKNRLMNWRKRFLSDTALTNYSKMHIHEIYAYLERALFYKQHNDIELYNLTLKRLCYTSAQHIYLIKKNFGKKDGAKETEILKSIIKHISPDLLNMECWSLITKIRIAFIRRFPVIFGKISISVKLDLEK